MENKKKSRLSYLDSYEPDGNGGYRYRGKYYRFSGDAHERKALFFRLLLLLAAGVVLSVGSGCLDGAGSTDSIYVVLPLTAEIVTVFYTLWKTVVLFRAGEAVKEHVLSSVRKQLSAGSFLFPVFAGIGFASDFIYVLLCGSEGKAVSTTLYLSCKVLSLADGILMFRAAKKLRYEVIPEKEPRQ